MTREHIDLASGFGGGWDPGDDWAVVELASTWQAAGASLASEMRLSAASDSRLDGLTTIHNIGFPAFAPTCTAGNGLFFNRESEPLTATFSRKLRLQIDSTGGHSGGPYYYFPTGNDNVCRGSETPFAIGIVSGYNSVVKRVVAAKVPAFRSTALALIGH